MDLFQMQRYWSDDEGGEKTNSSAVIAKKLKAKLKKRKAPPAEKVEESELPATKTDAAEDGSSGHQEITKAKKRKKKKDKTSGPADFTVLGEHFSKDKGQVRRVLPSWLANPDIVSVDFNENQLAVEDLPGLHEETVTKLKQNGIAHFFPVQRQVIPWLLSSPRDHFFRPSDICVSAPTGSGKTLAFVVPIVQALRQRVVPRIRALVILPVQDLATQVYKVFQAHAEGTGLRIKMLSSLKSFAQEQSEVVRPGVVGHHSLVDILVATPGRLVDHIQKTEGFCLRHLRYLIIDEADRVMEDVQNDWLTQVESAVYSGEERARPRPLSVASAAEAAKLPLQKLLFSATLSQNPEQLQQLNLYEPRLFTSVVKPKDNLQSQPEKPTDEFVGQYTTPAELKESLVVCKDSRKKPQILLHLIKSKEMRKTLVFTKSVEHTHFLCVLLEQYGLSVAELSSQIQQKRRRVLNRFNSGEVDLLVCTDALARGIDIGQIDFVVNYDCPLYAKTYIHRVGRTARAGAAGSAITLLEKGEKRRFQPLLKEASKGQIEEIEVDEEDLGDDEGYENACKAAAAILEAEKSAGTDKKKTGMNRRKKTKSSS